MRAQGGMFVAGAGRRRTLMVAAVKRIRPLGWRGAKHERPSAGRESPAAIGSLPSDAAFSATAEHEGDPPNLASEAADAKQEEPLPLRATAYPNRPGTGVSPAWHAWSAEGLASVYRPFVSRASRS